jgi:transcription elongation factor Elf1
MTQQRTKSDISPDRVDLRDTFACPACGSDLDEIGCEKTVVCDECDSEWKYGDGMETLVAVENNDPIYWDR